MSTAPGSLTTILVVEDDRLMRANLRDLLGDAGYTVAEAGSAGEATDAVLCGKPALVLLDLKLPDGSGLDLLRRWKSDPKPEGFAVIVLTAFGGSYHAIEAIRLGAFDHLTKPFDADELLSVVRRARHHQEITARSRLDGVPAADAGGPTLIGRGPRMQAVYKRIGRAAAGDVPVLIRGESGTGKELVARSLHHNSLRSAAPFLAVNCAAIPAELIESELFGHEKGAFTGAIAQRQGVFERAHTGTLFLDEIGDLGAGVQAKLLRVLQEGIFDRVGGQRSISVDVRILAATHRDLRSMVAKGTFREDLFYRLNVVEIDLPPLRDHMEDFLPLVRHLIARYAPDRAAGVSDEALQCLEAYGWPGNVRELENAIRHALLMARDQAILPEHLPASLHVGDGVASKPDGVGVADFGDGFTLRGLLDAVESRAIRDALQRAGGVRTRAAQLLGIHRRQLYEKIKQYGL